MFQKLKHLIIGSWEPLGPGEWPTMCLDLFEGLETFTCGWESYETFLYKEPRDNTFGIFWEEMENKPEIRWAYKEDLRKLIEDPETEKEKEGSRLGVKAEAETGSTRTIQIRFQTGLLKPVSYKAG